MIVTSKIFFDFDTFVIYIIRLDNHFNLSQWEEIIKHFNGKNVFHFEIMLANNYTIIICEKIDELNHGL